MTIGLTERTIKKRLILFLRHHNDIDHLTPVVDRWSQDPENDAVVIGYTDDIDMQDFRLVFLESKENVRVLNLRDLVRDVARTLGHAGGNSCTVSELMLHLAPVGLPAVAAFDYVAPGTVGQYLKAAESIGMKTISLPHGDDPYLNYMITKDDLDFSGLRASQAEPPFDVFVSPSRVIARRAVPGWEHKHRILGSPRFCDEWLEKLTKLLPRQLSLPDRESLKLVFFLRNAKYAIFWEEFNRLLKMILSFKNIDLIVVSHPREYIKKIDGKLHAKKNVLPKLEDLGQLDKSSNLMYLSPSDIHSSELILWSDAVLSLGSSVVYEAVCRRKPVFEIEYLHPNRTVVSNVFRNANIQSRDDIYRRIFKLLNNSEYTQNFYSDEEMSKFRALCIDLGTPGVLDRYNDLLTELALMRE